MMRFGLTERICQLAERGDDVSEAKPAALEGCYNLGDDVYLDYNEKLDESMYCHVCDTKDCIAVGQSVYTLSGPSELGNEAFEPIVLCPKHLSEIAEQILLHIVRVSKGKEKGALTLPLRKWKDVPEGETE